MFYKIIQKLFFFESSTETNGNNQPTQQEKNRHEFLAKRRSRKAADRIAGVSKRGVLPGRPGLGELTYQAFKGVEKSGTPRKPHNFPPFFFW